MIQRQAFQIALDLGQKAPSYRVVRAVVKTIPADLLALAHEGKKAYSETFELVCRRYQHTNLVLIVFFRAENYDLLSFVHRIIVVQ